MKIDELNSQKLLEASLELENLNFKLLQKVPENLDTINKDKPKINKYEDTREQGTTQFKNFQNAMKVLLITGTVLGLNPVSSSLDSDVSKIRFTIYSWKFLYSIGRATAQTMATGFALYAVILSPGIYTSSLGQASFCMTTWCSTLIFMRIATKWESLIKEIYNCNLDKYVDPNLSFRCNLTCVVFLILGSTEYTLSTIRAIAEVLDCSIEKNSLYEKYTTRPFLWSMRRFDADPPHVLPMGIILQINHMMMGAIWTYSDTCIICISLYLASVLKEINKKILWAAEKTYVAPSMWGTLREEYSRATHLIRHFDDVFSCLVLGSFGTNLFFICLKFFTALEYGIEQSTINSRVCHNYPSGYLKGYEYVLDQIYCLLFLLIRFLTVALVAANVNVVSMVPASALYKVPSCSYSVEVQRFLDQVHDDVVALSGLEYFYITRGLVLSVVGTILTYELVLLQFNSEEVITT